ncbi:hypothetical protein [Massilia sp. CCM 8734]|nr:hypothetical protein [Massilia sp. CCM 8734]
MLFRGADARRAARAPLRHQRLFDTANGCMSINMIAFFLRH